MRKPICLFSNAYLMLSTSIFVAWLTLSGSRPGLRRQTLWIGLEMTPLGLTDPLYAHLAWKRNLQASSVPAGSLGGSAR